jgi:rhamnosyltransferase
MLSESAIGPRSDVCAIVVTFNPDDELPVRLQALAREVGTVVVVDNGSRDAGPKLTRIELDCDLTVVLNPDNYGSARALNIGIQRAVDAGFQWVLLMDQDSTAQSGMVEELLAIQSLRPHGGRLALIAAGYDGADRRAPRARTPAPICAPLERGEPWLDVDFVITSGSLLSIEAHSNIGPFREELFIDCVDIDYCHRARALGYRVVRSRRSLMTHVIGTPTSHRFLWMQKSTTNHPPDRRYYMARNDTIMLRDYGGVSAWYVRLKSLQRSARMIKRVLLYESMKIPKIAAILEGWYHGNRGRLGPRRPVSRAPVPAAADATAPNGRAPTHER